MVAIRNRTIYVVSYRQRYHAAQAFDDNPTYYQINVTQGFINNNPPIRNPNKSLTYISAINITPIQIRQLTAYKPPIILTPSQYLFKTRQLQPAASQSKVYGRMRP